MTVRDAAAEPGTGLGAPALVPDDGTGTDAAGPDVRRILARCDELATISAHPDRLERLHLTPEHARAHDLVETWMREAGMRTWQDAAGNRWGRVEGAEPGLPALVLGSHTDTVPDAGRYDGMLGVVLAIAVVERLRGLRLPFALEVVAFSDEEGTRFALPLLGSRAVAGLWDPAVLDVTDADGVSVAAALEAFGLDPARVGDAARRPEDVVGYLEAHIEQGPELEAADRSLAVVSSIAGARRFAITVTGEARHAGGTPYPRRRDALVGASEIVVAIEAAARPTPCLATVGRLTVAPGAVNVIAGRAELTLDLRAESDAARDAMFAQLHAEMLRVCERRGLTLDVRETHSAPSTPCAPWLQDAVAAGIRASGDAEPVVMWSRAGHDGMAVAAVTDVGMLFLRCHDGISHHRDEDVRAIDVARALDAFEGAVRACAQVPGGETR